MISTVQERNPLLRPNKGWHSRGYLPHFDCDHEIQSLNFRLRDAVPKAPIEDWKHELGWRKDLMQTDLRAVVLRRRIDTYEDAGHGVCFLRDPRIAELVESALLFCDGERYHLLA